MGNLGFSTHNYISNFVYKSGLFSLMAVLSLLVLQAPQAVYALTPTPSNTPTPHPCDLPPTATPTPPPIDSTPPPVPRIGADPCVDHAPPPFPLPFVDGIDLILAQPVDWVIPGVNIDPCLADFEGVIDPEFPIIVAIQNIGTDAAGSFIVQFDDQTQTVAGLPSGELIYLEFAVIDKPNATVIIDMTEAIDETDEANNVAIVEPIALPLPGIPCEFGTPTPTPAPIVGIDLALEGIEWIDHNSTGCNGERLVDDELPVFMLIANHGDTDAAAFTVAFADQRQLVPGIPANAAVEVLFDPVDLPDAVIEIDVDNVITEVDEGNNSIPVERDGLVSICPIDDGATPTPGPTPTPGIAPVPIDPDELTAGDLTITQLQPGMYDVTINVKAKCMLVDTITLLPFNPDVEVTYLAPDSPVIATEDGVLAPTYTYQLQLPEAAPATFIASFDSVLTTCDELGDAYDGRPYQFELIGGDPIIGIPVEPGEGIGDGAGPLPEPGGATGGVDPTAVPETAESTVDEATDAAAEENRALNPPNITKMILNAGTPVESMVAVRGETVVYQLIVTNPNDTTLANITVIDELPVGLDYVSVAPANANANWDAASQTFTYPVATLGPNDSLEILLSTVVKGDVLIGTPLANQATLKIGDTQMLSGETNMTVVPGEIPNTGNQLLTLMQDSWHFVLLLVLFILALVGSTIHAIREFNR